MGPALASIDPSLPARRPQQGYGRRAAPGTPMRPRRAIGAAAALGLTGCVLKAGVSAIPAPPGWRGQAPGLAIVALTQRQDTLRDITLEMWTADSGAHVPASAWKQPLRKVGPWLVADHIPPGLYHRWVTQPAPDGVYLCPPTTVLLDGTGVRFLRIVLTDTPMALSTLQR